MQHMLLIYENEADWQSSRRRRAIPPRCGCKPPTLQTTEEIARAFLVPFSTTAQRLVRATTRLATPVCLQTARLTGRPEIHERLIDAGVRAYSSRIRLR